MYQIRVRHPQWRGGFMVIGINRNECIELLGRKFPNQDYTISDEGTYPY
ncbi:MAG: hypothetical protein MK226_11195 [Saprospiraceae bacterium]|jgi:hypothetical protein|nr:hypothetical protein [Saprospiraceae bacterium]